MIAEVLSKSTKSFDKDEKFTAYRTIANFKEYLLIDQYTMHVELYSKTDNKKWIFSEYDDENSEIALTSVSQITLADIYDNVDFETEAI